MPRRPRNVREPRRDADGNVIKSEFSGKNFGPSRRAWFRCQSIDLTLHQGYTSTTEDADVNRFQADPIGFSFRFGFRKGWFSLHNLTLEELNQLEQFWQFAIAEARPVCEALDRVAQEEFDAGSTTVSPRLFRLDPQLVIRPLKKVMKLATLPATTPTHEEQDNEMDHLAGGD